ncbi:GvpL/GvpF family gas vesicle protein [Phormidium sp. FACHB-592]|uniref:GvpL/GvpF family gas vesicle protein n=1 Tax=Stenomitos frigidus AS-A4 TaxID=2933935 RepID=A0ABV0KIY9_9CYAN|nr:GvpL/GvpF family gas vesicle protein [Phormidium sp. FACHB-592]MBD2074733.1 GvpL/GvpF family gas vesicle protein [Phormidium sp. FACHB-592]
MYTYAFCQTPLTPLELPQGIATTVQMVTVGQLAAIVEPAVSLEPLQQDDTLLVQAALAHDRVIRSLCLKSTILPLRFGTCFNSLQGLSAHLETYQQAYLSQLTHLNGKAEYTLKLMLLEPPDAVIAPEIKGKNYFLAKKQQYQQQLLYQQQQQAAIEQIEQAVLQTYPEYCGSQDATGVKAMHLLVNRDHEQQLCDFIQALQQQYPQLQLVLGAALPPYHFVSSASTVTPGSAS